MFTWEALAVIDPNKAEGNTMQKGARQSKTEQHCNGGHCCVCAYLHSLSGKTIENVELKTGKPSNVNTTLSQAG